jgi:hypothetical protein
MGSAGLSVSLLCGISWKILKIQINNKKRGLWESYNVLVDFEVLKAVTVRKYYLVGRNAVCLRKLLCDYTALRPRNQHPLHNIFGSKSRK